MISLPVYTLCILSNTVKPPPHGATSIGSIGFLSTTMSREGGGGGELGLRLTCALGSSRKYPYTYHRWHSNFTTPCVRKFQNALPPPPLPHIRNSRLLYPSSLSELQRCFRPLQNFLFNLLTTQKSFFFGFLKK